MNANARVQLMQKLASGNQLRARHTAASDPAPVPAPPVEPAAPDLSQKVREMFGGTGGGGGAPQGPTECFMLSNMFSPASEQDPNWAEEIRSDVLGECTNLGGVLHIYVDPHDPNGCVYVKAVNTAVATSCVNSLQGRWFSGNYR
eukprot:sb/3473908/